MQLLTALTTRLADDEIRARIQSATTPDELLSALDDKGGTQPSASFSNAPTIVCVTACPAGIAHTYMAAEYLEKAGRKLGVNVYVEKQGANGIEGRLTADQLNSATACILRLKSPSRRVSVLMAFPRFQCLLPSRFAMQKR